MSGNKRVTPDTGGFIHTPGLRIMSWNVAGAKYLMEPHNVRTVYQATVNRVLADLAKRFRPHFITLQEIVRYSAAGGPVQDLIQPPEGYYYHPSIAIDTRNHTHPRKWEKFRAIGGWQPQDYLGQGSGVLWLKNIAHASLWNADPPRTGADISIEDVHIDTGLYTGDRDTEPRLVPVAHFVMPLSCGERGAQEGVIDVLLANIHLTTLRGEREGARGRDEEGSATRGAQLDIVFHGIVSRYNRWRRRVPQRGRPPVWFIAGDFNCTPGSREIAQIQANHFIDVTPCKGHGTKGHSLHQVNACIAVDYIFAGPYPSALQTVFALEQVAALEPIRNPVSDHLAVVAHLPLRQGMYWASA